MSNSHHPSAKRTLNRRDFIKVSALAAGVAALGASPVKRLLSHGVLKRTHVSRILMGSVANLTVIGDDETAAQEAINETFALMKRSEKRLSRFEPQSDLCRLNRLGEINAGDCDLRQVLVRALHFSDLSGGLFDVTLEPLLTLYRQAALGRKIVSKSQLAKARGLVDFRKIVLAPGVIRLEKPGMALNLDGIAKGWIIDQGADHLRSLGYTNVLVEVGGDLSAQGMPADSGWRVGIQSPQGTDQLLAIAEFQDQAMATSGDYLNTYTADHSQNHILDPRIGISPPELSSVSVLAPNACEADALSTSLMVLGVERGLALVEQLNGIEAALYTKDQRLVFSSGFPLTS